MLYQLYETMKSSLNVMALVEFALSQKDVERDVILFSLGLRGKDGDSTANVLQRLKQVGVVVDYGEYKKSFNEMLNDDSLNGVLTSEFARRNMILESALESVLTAGKQRFGSEDAKFVFDQIEKQHPIIMAASSKSIQRPVQQAQPAQPVQPAQPEQPALRFRSIQVEKPRFTPPDAFDFASMPLYTTARMEQPPQSWAEESMYCGQGYNQSPVPHARMQARPQLDAVREELLKNINSYQQRSQTHAPQIAEESPAPPKKTTTKAKKNPKPEGRVLYHVIRILLWFLATMLVMALFMVVWTVYLTIRGVVACLYMHIYCICCLTEALDDCQRPYPKRACYISMDRRATAKFNKLVEIMDETRNQCIGMITTICR